MTPSMDRILQVKRRHEKAWLSIDGVVAVGIGTTSDNLAGIVVSVVDDSEPLWPRIPPAVEGVPVEVRATGPLGTT